MTQRIRRHPFLALFDGPDPNSSTAGRNVTTVPTQALFFLNNPLVQQQSERFAGRLLVDEDDERRRVDLAYRLALGRPATDDGTRSGDRLPGRLPRRARPRRRDGLADDRAGMGQPGAYHVRQQRVPLRRLILDPSPEGHAMPLTPADPSRRDVLRAAIAGSGSLLWAGVLAELSAAASPAGTSPQVDPLAPQAPHFAPKAKRVIFLYMTGGVSHVESFDPKPKLAPTTARPSRSTSGKAAAEVHAVSQEAPLGVPPVWPVRASRSATCSRTSAQCVDDLCVIRSLKSDHTNHYEATLRIHTGSFTFARPSVGAWVSYGLGTLNRNLPSFVVIAPNVPYAGDQTWGSDFLPGCHQGTRVVPGPEPIADIHRRLRAASLQERELAPDRGINEAHLARSADDPDLAARIRSFETAFGMQRQAPEAFDLSRETDATLALYGLERGSTKGFAWQCLVARRLAERGVRFIELIDVGASNNWDAHGDMEDARPPGPERRPADRRPAHGPEIARAARRDAGRLDHRVRPDPVPRERRRPRGREHHHWAFSSWLAGGGVKPGIVHGATDEYGIARGRGPGPRPRLPRHDPPPAGPRPHTADLPPRRPRLPPDRRQGPGGAQASSRERRQ